MTTSSGAAKQLGLVKTTVEFVSTVYTDKSATDHVVSVVLGKDCKMHRVARREKICFENKANVFDDRKKENNITMVANLGENDLTNFNEKFVNYEKKFKNLKKNNEVVLESYDKGEILAHSVLNDKIIIYKSSIIHLLSSNIKDDPDPDSDSDDGDSAILPNHLSSVFTPLVNDNIEI